MLMVNKINETDLVDYAVEKLGLAVDVAERVVSNDCELREIIIDRFLDENQKSYIGMN